MSLLWALLVTDPLIIIATIILGAVSLVVSFFDPHGRRQIAIARVWARILLRLAGVRVRVDGLEKIPPGIVCVVAPNHLSYMDTPVVLAKIPFEFRFVAKHGLFQVPFLGFHLSRAGHVPVFRDNPRAAVKTMSQAAETIQRRGISLLIFPEGGRSQDGVLQEFNDGAAYVAIKAKAPVVPMALIGTREILPMGSSQPRRGDVIVRFGDPIPTENLTLHNRSALTKQIRNEIAAMLESAAPVR
ncbi:MAG TPA: lysophospholipid acyltransferase family protein [Bryobacteraceae bacterium]|jgi:1-acyl-sn-glycerol-3-phosphate acyltransferase|nr:lysophospholipid acyltransferase family protein [Bryobacteraceae bacterium]